MCHKLCTKNQPNALSLKESAFGWFLVHKYITMYGPYNVKKCHKYYWKRLFGMPIKKWEDTLRQAVGRERFYGR
jgi:hypothetical protein